MADLQELLDRFLANKDPRKYEVPKGFCEDLIAKLNESQRMTAAKVAKQDEIFQNQMVELKKAIEERNEKCE